MGKSQAVVDLLPSVRYQATHLDVSVFAEY